MVAVPYRAELRARLTQRVVGILLMFAVALALIAVAGRHDQLNLELARRHLDPRRGPVGDGDLRLARAARRGAARADCARSARTPGESLRIPFAGAGSSRSRSAPASIIGGIALVIDLETDGLAVVLAVALGGAVGELGATATRVARHERAHRGTIYRVEDPPGPRPASA